MQSADSGGNHLQGGVEIFVFALAAPGRAHLKMAAT
jgi:hypothetical protein